MPRSLSIITAVDKARTESGTAYIVLIEATIVDPETKSVIDTHRICHNNEALTYDGDFYTATSFELSFSENSGEIGEATLTMNDYNRYIRQQEASVGGAVGFQVRLMVINASDLSLAPELDLNYQVTGSSSKEWQVTWQLGAENVLALPFPRFRQYKDRCRFKYRGKECGYTGSLPECNLTLDGHNGTGPDISCAGHNNTIRFGGFPGLKSQI